MDTQTIADDTVLIVGAGLAGLFLALKRAPARSVIITPAPLGAASSSAWAQGGLAAALGPEDDPALHAADTEKAGAGLVDATVARLLAEEGPARVRDLIGYGVPFDRDDAGALILSLEAAHSRARIARVSGDRAGAEIMASLIARTRALESITVREGLTLRGLLQAAHGGCAGVVVADGAGRLVALRARETVLATGGIGGLYRVTTNPPSAQGGGLSAAYRLGALLSGLEFVQFHPTAIDIGADPAPLATEALRGDGAFLVDSQGRRFMDDYHTDADLAPRDVVARAIEAERAAGRGAFLDCRATVGAAFPDHFPTVFQSCMAAGIDPRAQPIPVAPAAHYHMGGVVSDLWGRSSVSGLSVVGECASTGAHGANRLASNSLLEAVVFADRIATRLRDDPPTARKAADAPPVPRLSPPDVIAEGRWIMSAHVGVRREAAGLASADAGLRDLTNQHGESDALLAALLIVQAAARRTESRGAHFRSDHPHTDDRARQSTISIGQP